jgi:hypothetical protein
MNSQCLSAYYPAKLHSDSKKCPGKFMIAHSFLSPLKRKKNEITNSPQINNSTEQFTKTTITYYKKT